jgi:small subunit ribosomal protein S6
VLDGASLTCESSPPCKGVGGLFVGSVTAKGRKVALNKYETIFIIDPGVESEDIESITEDVQNLISGSGGEVINVNRWGKKRLAYEVKGNRDGYYVLVNFAADPQFVQRLARYYGLTEQIIKYMTVRASGKLLEPRMQVDEDEDEDFLPEEFEEDEEE